MAPVPQTLLKLVNDDELMTNVPSSSSPQLVTTITLSKSRSLDDLVTSCGGFAEPVVSPLPTVFVTSTVSQGGGAGGGQARRPARSQTEEEIKDSSSLYEMPKCFMPPPIELSSVETFVMNAFTAHEQNERQKRRMKELRMIVGVNKSSNQSQDDDGSSNNNIPPVNPLHLKGYQGLMDILKRPDDPMLLRKFFVALRTADHGTVLQRLALSDEHSKLSNLIFCFDSTRPSPALAGEWEEVQAKAAAATAAAAKNVYGDANNAVTTALLHKMQIFQDYTLCDAHFHLMLGMVSTRPTRSKPLLTSVWKLLTKVPNLPEPLTHRLHSMLYTILRLIPKAKNDFFPIVKARWPFWRWSKDFLTWYGAQSFRVLEYFPTLRPAVFEMVINACVELDVNIMIKDNGDVTFDESEEQLEANKAKEDKLTREENSPPVGALKSSKDESIDEVSDKLDSILEMLFLQIQFFGNHDVISARRLFRDLLPTFERSVLPTHKAKFVQYCMFLSVAVEAQAAAMNGKINTSGETTTMRLPPVTPESAFHEDGDEGETILHREFAAKLIEIIVDPFRATTTRQSAACYLASFVSRATFVTIDTVCESVSTLMCWAEAYIESLGTDAIRASDWRKQGEFHALFYTVCQAAFYIMAFRGNEAVPYYRESLTAGRHGNEELGEPDVDGININSKRWTFLCGHPLQPLRFCLESVRSEFLHVAHFFGLIDEPVLNKLVADAKRLSSGRVNKKAASSISTAATLQNRRQTGGVGGLGHGSNPLRSFFPFDPLLLRRTHEFVEPIYRNWQGPLEEEDVLIIDEVAGDGIVDQDVDENHALLNDDDHGDAKEEGVFEMEEDQGASEVDDDDDTDKDVTNGEEATETDDEESDAAGAGRNRSETLSTINSNPETDEKDPVYGTPQKTSSAMEHKDRQQKAWTDILSKKKRPRSQSMDGSW